MPQQSHHESALRLREPYRVADRFRAPRGRTQMGHLAPAIRLRGCATRDLARSAVDGTAPPAASPRSALAACRDREGPYEAEPPSSWVPIHPACPLARPLRKLNCCGGLALLRRKTRPE